MFTRPAPLPSDGGAESSTPLMALTDRPAAVATTLDTPDDGQVDPASLHRTCDSESQTEAVADVPIIPRPVAPTKNPLAMTLTAVDPVDG